MLFFRQLFRATHVALVFAYRIVEVLIKRPKTRPERAAWLTSLCRTALKAAHISYSTEGPVPMAGAVITNHLNYTDILIHSAMRPCVFVSKAELRKTPILGWISMMAGTQYVQRGAGGSAQRAAEGMAKGFRDGLPIVFFPEGTTGTGEIALLPFRSGLLAQAMQANQPITSGWLHYELSAEDLANGLSTEKDLHWGAQTLVQHLWKQCAIKETHCTIRFAEQPIPFSDAAIADRKIAAREAHADVLKLAKPIQPGQRA